MGLSYSLSKGIISAKRVDDNKLDEGNPMEFFQTDASINTGNSGGPMFNYKGEVVGIVSAILSRSGGFEGIGFAATSNLAQKVLFKQESFWFGIDGHYLEGTLAEVLNIPQDGGLMVTSVTPNSPAYYLGVRGGYLKTEIAGQAVMLGGDIILSIEGIKLDKPNAMTDVWKKLETKEKSEEVKISILRSGHVEEFTWRIK